LTHPNRKAEPLVSVILTVYNRLTFFADALRSVEAQTFQDYEVIVADDSGSGAAREASLASNSPRVRYKANPASVGVALSLRGLCLRWRRTPTGFWLSAITRS
jgi:glycosyltransferase involved in cell wall biosynthesis